MINFQNLADLSALLDSPRTMQITLMLNAELTLEPSRKPPCLLMSSLIVKLSKPPSVIHVIKISTRIQETWDIRIPGHTLELHF